MLSRIALERCSLRATANRQSSSKAMEAPTSAVPPDWSSGGTALVGASIAFELLCLLAEARSEQRSRAMRLNIA